MSSDYQVENEDVTEWDDLLENERDYLAPESARHHGPAQPAVNSYDTCQPTEEKLRERRVGKFTRETQERTQEEQSAREEMKEMRRKMEDMQNQILLLEQQNLEGNKVSRGEKMLPQDSFSFIVVGATWSSSFLCAVVVYMFQMITFALLTLDLVSKGDGNLNPFGIPADVSLQLRVCQFIAILVAVFTQGDLMTGFGVFRDGYNNRLGDFFKDARPWKFWLSLIARLTEGSVGLILSFLLITTAETVVDLLLNFTAIEFVSNLDEVLFFLSKQGFMGKTCKTHATVIANATYMPEKKRGRAWKLILLLSILMCMMVGWAVVIESQESGKYFCRTLLVQFSDDFRPELGTFSGLYDIQTQPFSLFSQNRVRYVERRALQIDAPPATFGFCDRINSWTFRWQNLYGVTVGDPCDWVARSEQMDSFDLIQSASSSWYVQDSSGREVVLQPFHLSCADCTDSEGSDCGGHGSQCSDGVCDCNDGWLGLRCEFPPPCSMLSVDSLTDSFASTRDWADNYAALLDETGVPVEAYHRPVFVHDDGSRSQDILVYIGRRWALTSSMALVASRDQKNQSLHSYFQNSFHGYNLAVYFLSEPGDIGTPKDDISPVGLEWFQARGIAAGKSAVYAYSPDDRVNTRLLCQICDDIVNPCMYDGRCGVNSTCECAPGAFGALCQSPPTSNGYCNEFYNTPEFKLDGGDCCESTCSSTEQFKCGYDVSGLVFIGYPFCKLMQDRWLAQGQPIVGDAFSLSGSLVALSRDGAVLAIAEPGANRVRLFDKDGSSWLQRATELNIPMRINTLAISTGPTRLLNTPTFVSPVLVALAGKPDGGVWTGLIYDCQIQICEEKQRVPGANTVAISSDGSFAAFGLSEPPRVQVLSLYKQRDPVREEVFLDEAMNSTLDPSYFPPGMDLDYRWIHSLSLSTTGNKIVLDLTYPETNTVAGFDGFGSLIVALTWNGSTYAEQISYAHERRIKINPWTESFDEFSRPSFAASGNADVILVTIEGCAHQVLKMRGGQWVKQGATISRTKGPSCSGEMLPLPSGFSQDAKATAVGQSVAMSEDGSSISIGSDTDVSVFQWNGKSWDPVGKKQLGGAGAWTTLSSDGTILAAGLPNSQRNYAGGTHIFSRIPTLPEGTSHVRISVTPDTTKTSWELRSTDQSDGAIVLNGDFSWGLVPITDETIVGANDCLTFTLYPYQLFCEIAISNGCTPIPSFSDPPRFDIFVDGIANNNSSVLVATNPAPWFDDCADGMPTTLYPPRQVLVGNCAPPCPRGMRHLQIMVHSCASNATLSLRDNDSDIEQHSSMVNAGDVAWESICIEPDGCYNLTIENDGYAYRYRRNRRLAMVTERTSGIFYVFLDDDPPISGGSIGGDAGFVEIQLGNC